jgi:hypothetical protein
MHRLVESIAKTSESNVDIVQTAVVRTLRAIMTSPKCGVHEIAGATFDISRLFGNKTQPASNWPKRPCWTRFDPYFFSHGGVRCHGSRSSAKDCDAVSDTKSKSVDVPAAGGDTATAASPEVEGPAAPLSIIRTAYCWILCKMCSKRAPCGCWEGAGYTAVPRLFNTQVPTDPLALNSKILSLESDLSWIIAADAFFEEKSSFTWFRTISVSRC